MRGWRIFKDERGFTGLEAAIVLVAFVVVAAVFSYVTLNAGFFTTQKSQQVVHTGVQKASQSIELAGDVIGFGNTTSDKLEKVNFTLQSTAGASSVDLTKTTISYIDKDDYKSNVTFTYSEIIGDGDSLIESHEKFEISVNIAAAGLNSVPGPNDWFQIEVKPEGGAVFPIKRTVPAQIDAVMPLY